VEHFWNKTVATGGERATCSAAKLASVRASATGGD
jgi:hypothetical protein